MKAKINEISFPMEMKRGRLDLTKRREEVGLTSPMTSKEKAVIEERITAAIHEAVSPEALLRAHEASLQAKLQELKRNRKALSGAKAKDSATDKNQGNGKNATT